MKLQQAHRAILLLMVGGITVISGCNQHQSADTAVPGGNQPTPSSTAATTPAPASTRANPPTGATPVNGGTSGNPAGADTAAH